MYILADAVHDGLFYGLRDLILRRGPRQQAALRAIVNTHKCTNLRKLEMASDDVSVADFRDAFTAGAFPNVTHICTSWGENEEADDVIYFIKVLEARATPLQDLHVPDLPEHMYDTPAFFFWQCLCVQYSYCVPFDSIHRCLCGRCGRSFDIPLFLWRV
jgi:hypothetical protein